MGDFCTKCGYKNEESNKNCVGCGAPLTQKNERNRQDLVQKSSMKKKNRINSSRNQKPKSLMVKLASGFVIILIAALVGLYTWGTQTVSADAVFIDFFEALSEENEAAVAEVTIFSDGREITDKEAHAFIELHQKSTVSELRKIVGVEKSGKFLGIIDAYKIIMPSQKAAFSFPYEGLSLKLNGKEIKKVQDENYDYVFSGIVPGIHEAEFVYEGEFTEFTYPFELTVPHQSDLDYIFEIEEELPISSVTFEVDVFNELSTEGNKILLAGNEIPLDNFGSTEEVGPLLLDGSMEAQAEIVFPWGTQKSDLIPITDEMQMISITQLTDEEEENMANQVTLFVEEYIQAVGTRESAAFTTLTDEKMEDYNEMIESMHYDSSYFEGFLEEVSLYEDSFQIDPDGRTVSAAIRVLAEGDYFTQGETPYRETLDQYWDVIFEYDAVKKEWLVADMYPDHWSEDFTPTRTVAGSKKLYELKDASVLQEESTEVANQAENEEIIFSEERKHEIEEFFYEYNENSVIGLNTGDPSYVYGFLAADGPRLNQQKGFIKDTFAKGITEEHISTTLENVIELADDMWQVTTIEVFIIHGTEKSSEKTFRTTTNVKVAGDMWQIYELISTPEI